jgi:hypothetical protein
MSLAFQSVEPEMENDLLLWIGQSGQRYRLEPVSFSGFQLRDGEIHVLVAGTDALWAGSADDVVSDPLSRSRFRDAMVKDVAVYRLEPTPDEDMRIMIAWDIANGRPAAPLKLVDAG